MSKMLPCHTPSALRRRQGADQRLFGEGDSRSLGCLRFCGMAVPRNQAPYLSALQHALQL